jgi:hypothetical protein
VSTRRKQPPRRPIEVRSTGIKVQARNRYGRTPPTPAPGVHLWVIVGAWRIINPATTKDPTGEIHLDVENLITLDGPGCFVCEQQWTPDLGCRPCPGDPGAVH